MTNYEVWMGIEIHLELNTKTKMFSHSLIAFNTLPNTLTNEIDLGYPGSLPVVNEQAVIKGIKLAKALDMQIDPLLRFDRKNYFYPDLPKGFQITQQFHPLGLNGKLAIEDKQLAFVAIERIHLEEDTAKSIHTNNLTFLDYNRAGIPLIEIVTKPCLKTAEQVVKYVNMIRLLALALNISDAKMEEGSLRVDVNLSLKHHETTTLGTKVEIKNLNSINNIVKAIAYEIKWQTQLLQQGLKVLQATKRFDEKTQQTVVMRVKKDTIDYKYFPEPNIPPISLSEHFLAKITLPELPWAQKKRYKTSGIDDEFIEQLLNSQDKAHFFDQVPFVNKNQVAKVFFSEIVSLANRQNKLISTLNINPRQFSYGLELVEKGTISLKQLKEIIPNLINHDKSVDQVIQQFNFKQINNKDQLSGIIKDIIAKNKDFIAQNYNRPERMIKFILGKVMQQTKGRANPQIASEITKKLLEK